MKELNSHDQDLYSRVLSGTRSMRRPHAWFFTRAGLAIFAVGVVLLVAGIYGAWRVHRLHSRGNDILSDNVASIRAAEELDTTVRELRYRIKRYLSSGNERHLEHVATLLPQGHASLEEAASLAKSEREQQLVERVRDGYGSLRDGVAEIRRRTSAEARDTVAATLADEVIPNEVLVHISRYVELNEQSLDSSRQRNQATANRLMFGLLLLGTCGGVAGLFAGYGFARLVNRTIVQLAIPIRDTAGKLNEVAGPVAIAAEPELKDLESILKKVSDHVTTVVERLQESERDRLHAEQLAAVGQLAAGLAHELRNPLTSMKAILQLADQPADLTHRDLDVLQEETGRLEHSVQSLLDFARPPQPQKQEIDAHEVLEQAVHLVQRRAERQNVTITFVPQSRSVRISADAVQLRQVFLNLLLNAIDVSPRGACIQLECCLEESDRKERLHGGRNGNGTAAAGRVAQAVIRISDRGPGLPAEFGERIFDPFVTAKETGTGLGLSICRRIVQSHGGTIAARNRPRGGAEFEVRLPSFASAQESSAQESRAGRERSFSPAASQNSAGADDRRSGGTPDGDGWNR